MADISFVFCREICKNTGVNRGKSSLFPVRGKGRILVKGRFFNNLVFPEKKFVQIVNDIGEKMHKKQWKILLKTCKIRAITAEKIVHEMLKT